MKWFFKSVSVVFHPLFIPAQGTLLYFWKSQHFVSNEIVYAKLTSISILTIILPVLIFFMLKTLGKVQSVTLRNTNERIIPLGLNCIIIYIVIYSILTASFSPGLYYFFLGLLMANILCLILAIFKLKVSLHIMYVTSLFMFTMALSLHFSTNLNGILILMSIIIGAVASARLYLKAHSPKEITLGLLTGIVPQLFLIPYWI
ncbi:MAG: hypothetical protein ACK5MZ_07290 [Aestuariibaculum sp.]